MVLRRSRYRKCSTPMGTFLRINLFGPRPTAPLKTGKKIHRKRFCSYRCLCLLLRSDCTADSLPCASVQDNSRAVPKYSFDLQYASTSARFPQENQSHPEKMQKNILHLG